MNVIKSFFLTIGQLIVILCLALVARECWRIYKEQKKSELVLKDGYLIRVRIQHISDEKKTWRDYIGNSRYITFRHEGRETTMRYIQDSIYLGTGAVVPVLYSPGAREYIQQQKQYGEGHPYKTSPLVKWTVLRILRGSTAALFFFVFIGGIVVLMTAGVLVNLTGISVIGKVGRIVAFICAVGAGIFFTYDAWSYWRYYSNLRNNGAPATATIGDISRLHEFNNDHSQVWILYVYRARVSFKGEQRIIAAGREDYETLKPGSQLDVLYDQEKDDMVSKRYSLQFSILLFPLLLWVLIIFITKKSLSK